MKKEQMLKHYFFPNLVEIFADPPVKNTHEVMGGSRGWALWKKILTVWAKNDILKENVWDPSIFLQICHFFNGRDVSL